MVLSRCAQRNYAAFGEQEYSCYEYRALYKRGLIKNSVMLEIVVEGRNAAISEMMKVKRILPFRLKRMVGPFIFMDHAGPVQNVPSNHAALDVLPHPHIGLSTVTYLFGGKVTHRDSLGVQQVIQPGEVNWMTAGKGIAHSERFEDPALLAGGALEMIQTWVALPENAEESSPTFNNYKPEQLPIHTDKGVWMRLIAGDAYGLNNSVKFIRRFFICMLCWRQTQTLACQKNILIEAFISRNEVLTLAAIDITLDRCLSLIKVLILL
jgi:redox-sensitive bicupin YhaK (pirin superfamily)